MKRYDLQGDRGKEFAMNEDSVAFIAYNQAVEDAQAAIRAATTNADGSEFFSATFINAIARRCSPHVYVNRLAAAATSSDTWGRWFERLGDKATAEIVNATADLVTDERLAALVDAKVLPSAAPVEQPTFKNTKEAMLYAQRNNIPTVVPVGDPSTSARAAAEEIREWIGISGLVDGKGIDEVAAIIERHYYRK